MLVIFESPNDLCYYLAIIYLQPFLNNTTRSKIQDHGLQGQKQGQHHATRNVIHETHGTHEVVVGVFNGGECQHSDKWDSGGDRSQRRDGRDQLQHQQA